MRGTMQEFELTIPSLVRQGVATFRDSLIVTRSDSGTRRATFAEVWERATRLAHALSKLGVDGDQRVATFQWNNQEHVEVYLAVPSMGAVLHTLNHRLFSDQLVYIANHAEDRVIIVDASLAPQLAEQLPRMPTVEHVIVVGAGAAAASGVLAESTAQIHLYDELLAASPSQFAWPEIEERSAAAMCYTSGTTGDPKGVVYTHRSSYLHTMALLNVNTLSIHHDDRILPVVPMFHANGWGLIYAVFMSGADLILTDRLMQAEPLVAIINEEAPTIAAAVPAIWNELAHYTGDDAVNFGSIKVIYSGGSQVSRSLMELYRDRYGIPIIQGYGLTETSPLCSLSFAPKHTEPGSDEYWRYRLGHGRVAAGVEARICGPNGELLPHDGKATGEIELRGPWVAGSYYRDNAPDRFRDGWLRTGDIGHLDDRGYVGLTDRSKDVIKSGGEWISSLDLENELVAHRNVVDVAVIGVPDDRWDERPLVCVVLQKETPTSFAELRDHLTGRVARWQVPERWVAVEALPRTSVEKIDKKLLREEYAAGKLEAQWVSLPKR